MTKRGLNIGCGRITLPCARPEHHSIVPAEIYTDPDTTWINADMTAGPGVNEIFDCMRYPWPLADNSFDVALAAHIVEHIPHSVTREGVPVSDHGGWWAWWDEMARVLKPGGVVYVLAPYGWSVGALIDPTHTRAILWESFGYFKRNPDAPFDYSRPWEFDSVYSEQNWFTSAVDEARGAAHGDSEQMRALLLYWMKTRINIVSEICIGLKVSK